MKRKVVINESTINRIMKEVINEMAEYRDYPGTEELFGTSDEEDEEQYDEYEHVDSVEYIVETYINGNISYAIERIKELSPIEILDLQNVAEEYGVLDKINNLIRKAYGKLNEEATPNMDEMHLEGLSWIADDDDWITVNTPEEGKLYGVKIWCGKGQLLDLFKAYADSEENAIEKVVAYLDNKGKTNLFVDEAVEEERKKMEEEGKPYDEIEDDIDTWAYWVDATNEGAKEPHYIYIENLGVKELPNSENSLNESKSLYNRMLKVRF